MKNLKNFVSNLLLFLLAPALFLGMAEWGTRTFYSRRLNTYFDDQTQLVLGKPAAPKAPGEYRIFIFGSSAAYGFPVADRYSIAAWLRKSFPALTPGRKVMVINAAWPGKSSHQAALGARTVLKYHPDLFIIDCGNNEAVIDNRLYVDSPVYRLGLTLEYESAFYRLLTLRLNKLRKYILYHGHSGHAEKQYRNEVIANLVYKKTDVSLEDYRHILGFYEKNMQRVIRTARANKIDVLFLTLPGNIRDIPPGRSLHHQPISGDTLTRWNEFYEKGQALQKKGDCRAALDTYRRAEALEPTYAELQYQMGICYEKTGDYTAAKQAYRNAKDDDANPWRSKTELNETLRRLAAQNGLMLLDTERLFEKLSSHGIISSELIYDNVHPTVQAQQVISDAILKLLWENDRVEPKVKWQWEAFESGRVTSEEWKVDGSLNAYHDVLKGLHLWEQKRYPEAAEDLEKATKTMPGFLESYAFLADAYFRMGKTQKAFDSYEILSRKDPRLLEFLAQKYPDIGESRGKSAATPMAAAAQSLQK